MTKAYESDREKLGTKVYMIEMLGININMTVR